MKESYSNTKILCCIPTKNAEQTIGKVLAGFSRRILDCIEEIAIIDNDSTDKTIEVAKAALQDQKFSEKKVNIFQNSTNYGLGGTHKVAFRYAYDSGYDYLLIVHGDNVTDVKQFLKVLQGRFNRFDMVLSTRLSRGSIRQNYSFNRFLFNKLLSWFVSLLFLERVEDFSGGGINLYRVQSFVNKFENAVKHFSNDVSFSQHVLLYGIFRRHNFYFHPVSIKENDNKTFKRLASQFLKSLLLVLKFRLLPQKTIRKDLYGSYFGHNFRKIKVREVIDDLVKTISTIDESQDLKKEESSQPVDDSKQTVEVLHNSTSVEPVSKESGLKINELNFKFTDLKRLALKDQLPLSFDNIDFAAIEAVEKSSSSILVIEVDLDVNNLIGHGLKSFFLRAFKVYSPNRLMVFFRANENILKTKQCIELVEFVNKFRVSLHLIVSNPVNLKLWHFYSEKADGFVLNFECGVISRSEFYNLAKSLSYRNKLFINIYAPVDKFYYCYGLKDKLIIDKIGESVLMLPFEKPFEEYAQDHQDIMMNQADKNISGNNIDIKYTHSFSSKNLSQLDLNPGGGEIIKNIKIDGLGKFHFDNGSTGSIFKENMNDLTPFINQ